MKGQNLSRMAAWAASAALLLLSGCAQIDVTVEMHDKDPGATVRERVRVSRRLLEACPAGAQREKLLGNLEREAALERMKLMGKGVKLVSHEKKALPDGGVQSLVVYRVPDIRNLQVTNPFVDAGAPGDLARINCGFKPKYNVNHFSVHSLGRMRGYPKGVVRKTATPLERQILRELRPVLVDMLSDFRASLKLKVPTRFLRNHVRNLSAGPKVTTLFSVSGQDLDRHGNGFFDNEEIMLALMEMDFSDGTILKHTGAFLHNSRTPVLRSHPDSRWFTIRPTAYYRSGKGRAEGKKARK
jgi:hypothetical protein